MSELHPTDTQQGYRDHYVPPSDELMRAALRDGTYILAVACRACGAPLTATRSKQLGIGPACRRKESADLHLGTEGAA